MHTPSRDDAYRFPAEEPQERAAMLEKLEGFGLTILDCQKTGDGDWMAWTSGTDAAHNKAAEALGKARLNY